jgi:hypothetical protein
MYLESIRKEKISHSETNYRFIFGVLLAYAAFVLTGIFFHSMWRDELHSWALAGASGSVKNLLQLKATEGHPDLWYLLIYAVRLFSDNPFSMQLMHAAIAITTAFLILKYAPFTRVQRVLLISGYFYLFEYALISRNYATGILLITVFLVLYSQRTRYLLWMSVVLFFMAQTNVFALILVIAFQMTMVFEFIFSPGFRKEINHQKVKIIVSFLIVIIGILYSIHTIIPPPTAFFVGSSNFTLSQLTFHEGIRSIATIWRAWIPVPLLHREFWDTNLIPNLPIQVIFSLILVFSAGLLFIRRPLIFFLFIIGSLGIISFILMYYFGYIRHHGHLYILLICCLWLGNYYMENDYSPRVKFIEKYRSWLTANQQKIFIVLLSVQLFAGVYAFGVQLFVPFSAARETAAYISQQNLGRFMIAGDEDIALEPVIGYLKKNAFFFSRKEFSAYLVYDAVRINPSPVRFIKMADSLEKIRKDTILLVMNYSFPEQHVLNLQKLKTFTSSIQYDEKYYLYLLCPPRNPSGFFKIY